MFRFCVEVFWQGCQNFFLHFQSNIWIENYCLKKIYRFVFFSSSFGSKVCRKIVKIAVFNSRGIVMEKAFVWKKTVGSKMFFGLRKESFRQDCQNCILLYQRNNVGEFFLEKTTVFFFSGFGWKVFGIIVKIAFWFSGWTICHISLLKRINIFKFFSVLGWKIFGRFVKTALYLFRWFLRRKLLFEKTIASWNFFRLRWESFRQNCGYYTLLFQRNVLGENFCFEKKY